jgi:8-oxo-dGTP pyrophosphatase MutT (NUDIX family)
MAFLDHIRACNAHDLSGYRHWLVDGIPLGWVRHALADRLAGFGDIFAVTADAVTLMMPPDFDRRTAAMAGVVETLSAEGLMPGLRRELYAVSRHWGAPPLLALDRAAAPLFGIATYGIHVNGFVRRDDGLHLWIGRRAEDRLIAPGKLDNIIAGGQPLGLTLAQNLLKEGAEEAGLTPDILARAIPVGAVTYRLEKDLGLKPDTLFLYDLELPAAVIPRNTDGEVADFTLMPVAEVTARVRDTDDFKFNVSLVIIDFLIRHGQLTPDEPDYLALVTGLRR